MASDSWKDASDGDRQSPSDFSPDASGAKSAGNRSKASIRASLACVQCRSKHVKCDAKQPACGRCVMEEKPCYYTKSRRGIRDPKKRSLISDKPPISSPQYATSSIKSPPRASLFGMPNPLSSGWTATRLVDTNEHRTLACAFFDYFYPGHPTLPPKNYFLGYVESDPNAYHFLFSVIDYCGALYTGDVRLNDLREATYSAACGPLPFTVQSVQGLHLLSTIAFGESKFAHHVSFGNRCWKMAIELGMHRKAFADRTSDPVWAESYRRTWWFIKFQGMIRRSNETEPAVETYDVESDVDIPYSEEWQYQSGDIPPPVSLLQHEREVDLGRSEFPSLAFQIELCRIQAEISFLCNEINGGDDENIERINQADLKICNFLRRIPKWKMDVKAGSGSDSPGRGPDRKGQLVKQFGWNPHPVDIQVANSVCDLFRYSIPIKCLRPMMVPGLLRVAIVYLDACVFLGLDSPIFRERINSLIRILTLHGETWPLSRKIAEDIQAVADEYLPPTDQLKGHSSSPDSDEWNALVADALNNNSTYFGSSAVGFDHHHPSFLNAHLPSVLLNSREPDHIVAPVVHSFSAGR
ncbi:hypothetical protein NPX13_g6434 [Xylaria arbuscula]|uniref:Zn(2)-C6 fungal-type domain-containing protein n=1 Tax=Xylaria arbuscula TaxID=114810 RepID=A0A9W8NCW4_9PEZI|nr:hypothetical protein NPX13_g6434 [Xylaria arbuscula]